MEDMLIIFDLDDCLVDTWGAIVPGAVHQAVISMVKAGLSVESFDKAVARLNEINEQSKNGTEAIQSFLNELKGEARFLDAGKEGFYSFAFNYKIKPLPGVLEMLEKTKAAFAIVTKGEFGAQIEKMLKGGINPNLFKKILAVPAYNKKEYYEQLMKELNYSPEKVLVVGDRYETDLLPAKELGIKTIYVPWGRGKINPPKKEEVDFVVTDLKEVISIVNQCLVNYKVCIPAAGIGSRMKEFTRTFNKALIPIQGKPAICHIIEKFPKEVEIVIALGYKKETVTDYLNVTYPDRKFTFVEVDRYEGQGTGPGYSILQCKDHLKCPFIFISADTLVSEIIPPPDRNWFGLASVKDTSRFCSAEISGDKVVKIDDKVKNDNKFAFIGLAGVYDYKAFWEALENNRNLISGEIQVSNGFTHLIEKELYAKTFTWFDTGTPASYDYTIKNYPHGVSYVGE